MTDGDLRTVVDLTTKTRPVFYKNQARVTEESLAYAKKNPTKMAAWVLRNIIDELQGRREDAWRDGRT